LWVGTAAVVAGAARGPHPFSLAVLAALGALVVGGVVRAAAADGDGLKAALAGTVWAAVGLLYIPSLLGYLLRLRATGPMALEHTLLCVGLVWLADVTAFLVGASLGRRRLAPRISPGKTVEGAVAALVVAALAGAGAATVLAGIPPAVGAALGLVLAASGLVGDLWESLLKRAAGVKDSGAAVPGHGGVLDRFDSLLLALPAGYWLLAIPHLLAAAGH
jgi:phosphatidate cytidylyltransferase